MTKQEKLNSIAREKTNKEWKLVRVKNDTHASLTALKEQHDFASYDETVKYLLDNQK